MKPAPLRELGRFAIVGLSAVGTDFFVYFLASRSGAMSAWLAKTLSFLAGALVSFVFNRLFTFRARGSVHRHAAGFALLYLVTEELLTEAHETEDTPLLTATFFAGFLLILVLSFTA